MINKVIVAMDSFKGSVSSLEAGLSVKKGIEKVKPNSDVEVLKVSDGGEGLVEALIHDQNDLVQVEVLDPLQRKIVATYGVVNETAIMEMATCCGLTLIDLSQRNPYYTTTYGLGQMIKDALNRGIRKFIIGIGGSATNDGGVGMLQALGYHFLNKDHKEIKQGGFYLQDIDFIDDQDVLPILKECEFNIACDVKNPLCHENGASFIFGSQKGASMDQIKVLDASLQHYALKTKHYNHTDYMDYPGTGAAGGLGFAFLSYLPSKLVSGIDLVLDFIDFDTKIKGADLIITGEGKMDQQSLMNKTPIGITSRAKKQGIRVIALTGNYNEDVYKLNKAGVDGIFSILPSVMTLQEAMDKKTTQKNIELVVSQLFRVL